MLRLRHLVPLLVLASLLLFALSFPAGAQGPAPQGDSFFGVVQAIHDPNRATDLGARWERLVAWWSTFQPNGPSDWSPGAWFDKGLIETEHQRGIETVAVVLHTPGWAARDATSGPASAPRNLELPFDHPDNYWGQFAGRLAGEYAGLIDTWILWNEPDLYRETYQNWAGTAQEFARMQIVGYLAIKRANPRAKVILSGTTYWWDLDNQRPLYLELVLQSLVADPGAALNQGYFDAVAVHQYSNPLNSFAVPLIYRRLMQRYGLDKPIWIVESNVVPHDDPMAPLSREALRATMEEQANYVIQSVALARAAGVERYSVYKLRDEEPENGQYYGLVRNDGSARPAYWAYQVLAHELVGISDAQYFWSGSAVPPTGDEITALLASNASYMQFVWPGALNGVRMRRGDDRLTVLWNVSAAPLEFAFTSTAQTVMLVEKYGERHALQPAADGAYHWTLSPATNNTDARNPRLVLIGGDPVIIIESGAADARDAYPRPVDACWGVPGALVPPRPLSNEAWVAPTGYAVSGPWLEYQRGHGDIDYLGLPRSPVVADPLNPDTCVQYFQRLVLEWHPENPPQYRIQRRLLTEEMTGAGPAEPVSATMANGPDYWYFPKGENGLGHAVSNFAPDGTWVGFKSYFDRYGREDAFGYPMELPLLQLGADGVARWTQRFQAAIFEYHSEFNQEGLKPGTDLPWRNWMVQLRLLGDEYLVTRHLPYIVGDPAQHVPVLPAPTP